MKWVKLTTAAVLAVTLSVQAQIQKPAVLDQAMVSISIPNVHGFLDEAGLVAANVQPGMNGAMLKMMLGMQLGDMNLMGIPAGGGLSVVALDPTNIFAVVEVSEAQSSAYLSMAQAKGLAASYSDGAVVLAQTASVLGKAGGLAAAVRSNLLAGNDPAISAAMQPAAVIERNRESVDGFMQMMPALFGMSMMKQPGATLDSTQSMTKILQAELMVLLSLSEQCSEAEVKIAPKNGSIVLSETFVPKSGTPLADLVNAPAEVQENKKLHAGLLGGGAVKIDFMFESPKALKKLVSIETEKVVRNLGLEDVDPAAAAAVVTKWIELYSGTGCETVSFAEDSFSVRYVMQIADEDRVLEVFRSMESDMAPFLKMYEGMGMPMTMEFKENVREADGVSIHQFSTRTDVSAMPPEQKEQMEAMGMNEMVFDLAVTDGLMFYSEAGGIEALIKRVKSGGEAPQIAARGVYPAGGCYYLDLDVGEYMNFIGSAAGMPQLGALFAGTPPITSAGFKQDGMVNWSVTVPGELIAKYGQMIMMQQTQGMQQMAAPPEAQ